MLDPLLVLKVLTRLRHPQAPGLGSESGSRSDLARPLLHLFPCSLLLAPVMPLVPSDSHSVPAPALVLARSTQTTQVYSLALAPCLSSGIAVAVGIEVGMGDAVVVAVVEVVIEVEAEAEVVEVVLPRPLLLRGLVG